MQFSLGFFFSVYSVGEVDTPEKLEATNIFCFQFDELTVERHAFGGADNNFYWFFGFIGKLINVVVCSQIVNLHDF